MASFRSLTIFRLRFALHTLIYALGLFTPWNRLVPTTSTLSTWLVLAAEAGRQGWVTFTGATIAVLATAILLSFVAALLRTWATAWIGYGVVQSGEVHGRMLVVGGPYRWLRHPLYLGVLLHTLALATLMQPVGGIFAVAATALLDGWLIRSEERYLIGKLGVAYVAYRREVPALVPRLRPLSGSAASTGGGVRWSTAAVSEVYFWGVAISFAVLGWRYNALLIERGILVAFGGALVARALLPTQPPAV